MINLRNSRICVLFIGDIVGRPGRRVLTNRLPDLKREIKADLVLANGENMSAGSGLTLEAYQQVIKSGVDYLTSGNHIYKKSEFISELDDPNTKVIRPANYLKTAPGRGKAEIAIKGWKLNLINLSGSVFMAEHVVPVFQVIDELIKNAGWLTVIDIHAEATSEKIALARYLDGKVAAVIGSHTHVPTADLQILPSGTLFISDVGMTGPQDGVLGVDSAVALRRFTSGVPEVFEVAKGPVQLNAIVFTLDPKNKKVLDFQQIIKRDL